MSTEARQSKLKLGKWSKIKKLAFAQKNELRRAKVESEGTTILENLLHLKVLPEASKNWSPDWSRFNKI